MRKHSLETLPLLNTRGQNLGSGENKTAGARVSTGAELDGPRISRTGHGLEVIGAGTGGGVQGRARGAVGEAGAVDGADGGRVDAHEGLLQRVVGRPGVAVVAERAEDVLAVAVPVDVQLDAPAGGQSRSEGGQAAHLGRVAGGLALVGLVAGVGGRAARDGPLVGPVAVDVGADAALAGPGLAVLAPETVGCLRVDEA